MKEIRELADSIGSQIKIDEIFDEFATSLYHSGILEEVVISCKPLGIFW